MFFTAFFVRNPWAPGFVCFEIIQTQNRWPNNIQKTSLQIYQIQIKVQIQSSNPKFKSKFSSGLSSSGLDQPGQRAPLLGLAKSIYISLSLFFLAICNLDIDECITGIHDCDVNANCTNTVGGHNCTCREGFSGHGRWCSGKLYIYKI